MYAKPTYLAVPNSFTGVGVNATQEGPFWNSNLWAQGQLAGTPPMLPGNP